MTLPEMPAAVLWDMDGTLIDTEPMWIEAEMTLAARFGVPWTYEDGLTLVGSPLEVSSKIFIDLGVRLPQAEVIDALVSSVAKRVESSMPWVPEARHLLHQVVEAGIPCALVTMSIGSLVDRFLEAAGDVFSAVVTGDQVSAGKPDPEAYLTAAARLGVDARDCVAIEDSPVGVGAAHASGAATIAVPRHAQIPTFPGVTELSSLEGIDVAELSRVLAMHRAVDAG